MFLRLRRLIHNLLSPAEVETDERAEIESYVEMLVEERVVAGMSEKEARRSAFIEVGGVEQVRTSVREQRPGHTLDTLIQDVRYGVKMLRRQPGFTMAAVLTIGLGVGVNTVMFSYADALLFRPLPLERPGDLVTLFHTLVEDPENYSSFSYPDYLDLREGNDVLEGLAAYGEVSMKRDDDPGNRRVRGEIVSGNYLALLGVRPLLGRFFVPEEDRSPGTHPVIVIGERFWRRSLQADPDVVGSSIRLNGQAFTIIGVAPGSFKGLDVYATPDFWVPLMMHHAAMPSFKAFGIELFDNRGTHWLSLVGRLRQGVTVEEAQIVFWTLAEWQGSAYPETNRDWSIRVVPAMEARAGFPRGNAVLHLSGLLAAVAGLVLLMACANVASLLLTRALSRSVEMGIRGSLGATRGRLIRQMLTENVVIAALAAVFALLLALWTPALLRAMEVDRFLPGLDARVDLRVLLFALVLSSGSTLLFGLLPSLKASATDLMNALRSLSGPGRSFRPGRIRAQRALVGLQIALSLLLMAGAGLMLRTLANLRHLELGFDEKNLLVVPISDKEEDTPLPDRVLLYISARASVERLAGVSSAGLGLITPFGPRRMAGDIMWERADGERLRTNIAMNVVDGAYFEAMSIPLLRGRTFSGNDREETGGVAIVNRALAERLWGNEDPIGQRIYLWNPRGANRPVKVVGVVADGRYYRSWKRDHLPFLFLPVTQKPQRNMSLYLRINGAAPDIRQAVRRRLSETVDNIELGPIRPMTDAIGDALRMERMGARILSLIGLLAVMLAAVGVHGVVAFSVNQRRREIGIRLALGATRGAVIWQEIRGLGSSVAAGITMGLLGAFATTRLLTSLLFGVRPMDPLTLFAVLAIVGSVALLAAYLPARAASRVDPLAVLKDA